MKNSIEKINKKVIQKTPFGSVGLVWLSTTRKPMLIHILLSGPGLSAENRAFELYPDSPISSCTEIDRTAALIKAYLEGEDVKFSLKAVDLSRCTKFQQSILRAQYAIPRGSVSTYGLIAAHVGAPGGARAVGNVMAYNPFPLIVPCHRTVLSNFHLGGFQSGTEMKRALLEREGIIFDRTARVVCRPLHYSLI